MNSYKTGIFSEILACIYLQLHGYKILHRRYITGKNTGRAEIDIIAKHGDLIAFIEVKRRKNIVKALDAVTPRQIIRLRRAAETYISHINWTGNARFDVIIITPFKIKWIHAAI